MKRAGKLLILLVCLLAVQPPAMRAGLPAQAFAAAKSGLRKENGNYYFYNAKGVRIRKKWKKIKGSSYYFGADGAAVRGKTELGVLIPAVKKINGKKYAFGEDGKRLSGTFVADGEFLVFASRGGVYNASATKKLRKASASGEEAGALRKLLNTYAGKPLKEEVVGTSCFGDGEDVIWYYKNFIVSIFRPAKGEEIVMGISAS